MANAKRRCCSASYIPTKKISAWSGNKYLLETIQMGARAAKTFEILKMYYFILEGTYNFCFTLLQKRTIERWVTTHFLSHLLYQFYSSSVISDHFCVAVWWHRIKRQLFCQSFFVYKFSLKPHQPQCSLTNQRLKRGSSFTGDISMADLLRKWKSSYKSHETVKAS